MKNQHQHQQPLKPITREAFESEVFDHHKPAVAFIRWCLHYRLDVPTECAKHHPGYLSWLIWEGFNCESARTRYLTWNSKGDLIYNLSHDATAAAGIHTTVYAGHGAKVDVGSGSTVTAGFYSNITAGHDSIVTCGGGSDVIAGVGSTITAGDTSSITVRWYDESGRYRFTAHYVDENGIKPNTPYRCNEDGSLTEVEG
jgi:hypothetical protein